MLQKDEFLRLIINSIRNDLISRNEAFQCLALGFIGNGKFQNAHQSELLLLVVLKLALLHTATALSINLLPKQQLLHGRNQDCTHLTVECPMSE